MHKIFIAIIAAGAAGAVWSDATIQQQYQDQGRFQDQPQASAYMSYGFGGPTRRNAPASLHYGLRLDHDSRLRANSGTVLPPLLMVDHDNRGETLATANGVPFAGLHLRLNDDDAGANTSGGGGNDSGWSFFDWGLLAVGVGGAGYLISQAVRGKSSPNATPSSSGGGGSSSSSSSGGLLSGLLSGTSSSSGGFTAAGGYVEERDFEKQRRLDGGTGQMGDLGGGR
jgi:hypothetical protein